jgi:hypothetical protein
MVAVAGASWDQLSGRLEMRVRDEVSTSTATVLDFELVNTIAPQAARKAYVMAGGSSPVGSALLSGSAMAIASLNTTVTSLCTCEPSAGDTDCTCTASITAPKDREVYALKAEYQCNGGARDICVGIAGDPDSASALCTNTIKQPPASCKDSCQKYHTLFDWHNIATEINADSDGEIELKVTADGMTADYCGAGHYLKVVFTLLY